MTEIRRISDARVLVALSHPLRRRILAMLKLDGPMTVGMLSQHTDHAVGSVSHHLRTLAEAGLVEEVPELARDRRERWWRRTAPALQWSSSDFAADPAAEAIAHVAESINLEYQADVVRQWAAADEAEKASWPDGPFSSDSWVRLTDHELAELGEQMIALVRRWADRALPDDGEDRRPVFVFARGVPGRP
jgi:DNA-binding transcriptional ArsR family regulator